MKGNSININIFCYNECCSSGKKWVKRLKIALYFRTDLSEQKQGQEHEPLQKSRSTFFSEITKRGHHKSFQELFI